MSIKQINDSQRAKEELPASILDCSYFLLAKLYTVARPGWASRKILALDPTSRDQSGIGVGVGTTFDS
jgi:hypothetical protein